MMLQHAARAQFDAGTTVGGKYRIASLIGMGGVGRVYLAKHIELDIDVAIKVLRPEMMERSDVVHRFAREARASVRLRSERIARVYDVGSHDGMPYFVMEYMLGCDLLELRQDDSVDIAALCELFIQACEGLSDAHAQGVVHRDIKPDNLFVVREANGWRSLKIFDFGISKFALTGMHSDVDLSAMRTDAMMGTPHYISPEQIRATRDVDHRTDIWSLGAVMFEVLSKGILPFREEREFTALIAEVLERPHRSLLDVAPNVPEGLCEIVDRCLSKDRDRRYQTAAEVAVALLPFAPARARASVERAVAAMQSAGLLAVNSDLELARTSQSPAVSTPSPLSSQPLPPSARNTLPSLRSRNLPVGAAGTPAGGAFSPAGASNVTDGAVSLRPNRLRLSFGLLGIALVGAVVFAFLGARREPEPAPLPPSARVQFSPSTLTTVQGVPAAVDEAASGADAAPSARATEPATLDSASRPLASASRLVGGATSRPSARSVGSPSKVSAAPKSPPASVSVSKPELRRER